MKKCSWMFQTIARVTSVGGLYGVVFISCTFSLLASADLPDLAPPKIQLVDEYGVNVHNGQVQSSLETVAIGGAMGLSHSISNYTNNFSIAGYRGYQDKFYAKGRVTELDTRIGLYKNVLTVHDISDSAEFMLIVGGAWVPFGTGFVSNSTYRALRDVRHTLERRADGVYWTKPDGTVVKFEAGAIGYPGNVGLMKQIKYPNGFTIDVDYLNKRVTTNTGFALKYIHQYDSADATMEPTKYSIRYDNPLPEEQPQIWANNNPKYVQAINTSVENCLAVNCTQNWPKAEFDWPAGMPRAIYLGDSTFKVTNAMGDVTEYYFRSFDLAFDGTTIQPPYLEYERYSPRLIGIKPAGSTERVFQYNYKNVFDTTTIENSPWVTLSSEAGQVLQAKRHNESSTYTFGEVHNYGNIRNMGGGHIKEVFPKIDQFPGSINQVITRDGILNYEVSYRNFPESFIWPASDMTESFLYDARGNMTSHTKGAVTVTASYPESCENSIKFCNSPTSTRDGKGNQTDYFYDNPGSGLLKRVTHPANKNGIRAETRYDYTEKYAKYLDANGNKVEYTIPIWLKTEERYCINSNASGGVCEGNDEVVTRYEYEHDNLFLTGMTVTEPQGKTLRTCYQYDVYGNRIGVTQPNANLTSCN